MTITKIQDKYNSSKVWLIKRYSRGEYYLSQAIDGKRLYAYRRLNQKYIKSILKGA